MQTILSVQITLKKINQSNNKISPVNKKMLKSINSNNLISLINPISPIIHSVKSPNYYNHAISSTILALQLNQLFKQFYHSIRPIIQSFLYTYSVQTSQYKQFNYLMSPTLLIS